jgi:hypothetical protein
MATRNLIVFACGIALIAAGFYTLAAGSLTLAPILLVAGYCVAVPLGIMMGGKRKDAGQPGAG